jgi:NAD(P)-dependent dehydrogenase (short-subunit alcohol dehydrogenase family)
MAEASDQPVVVVTGASAGIGRASAERFASGGARVALLARGAAGLEGARSAIERAGGTAISLPTDMADFDQVERAASIIEERLGEIDVWVNVAFASAFAPFSELRPDEFRRVTEVSYLGFVHGTMVSLARMRARDRGTIVQVGSALGARGIPLQSAYCGAKHAINGFTESLRCELLHDKSNVHVTVVQMPAVNTPQFSWVVSRLPRHPQPVPPIYQPEVAARAVVYAAKHPERKQYWVGASTVATLVAQKLMPAVLDRYLGRTGYNAQQTGDVPPEHVSNLWEPLDGDGGGDYGAHGVFDDRAHGHSAALVVSHHVRAALSATLVGAAGVTVAARRAHTMRTTAGRSRPFGGRAHP